MTFAARIAIPLVAGLLAAVHAPAVHCRPAPRGQAETVVPLRPLIDMPEGIAIDHRGNIYVSNRRLENDSRVCEILRIASDGVVTVVATLDPGVDNGFLSGTTGLAVNSRDEVFAGLASANAATNGIWHLRRDGSTRRLPGSEQMVTPNALTFDAQGNLYATDSTEGTVWRFPRSGRRGSLWIRDDLLNGEDEFGAIGANGIAFVPPSSLFVANTNFGWIARIPIEADGTAGQSEVVAIGFELLLIDGLVADVHGGLHAVIAGASIFGTAPLVHVDPRTGVITSSTTTWDKFDFPTSLAFGTGPRDRKSVYVVNAGLFPEDRPEAAPGIVRVNVGVPGFPAH